MIQASEIRKSYGRFAALRGVSFRVETGQVAGLLGPNGAGKSTTIRILTGFRPPDAGWARVADLDIARRPRAARRAVGYLPESAPLYDEMTVRDFLLFRSRLYGLGFRSRRAGADAAMARTSLHAVARKRIGTLSKGFRQRVALASALVHDPPVLILDEPTNGLDPAQVRELRALIRELAQERTMLISSHVLDEIERVCDRVVMLVGGRVRADGAPDALLRDAADRLGAPYHIEARPGAAGVPAPAAMVAALRERLMRTPGVSEVETALATDTEWVRITALTKPGVGDIRPHLAQAVAPALIREITRASIGLEDLFHELASRGESKPQTGGAA
ncbi:MAG: ABC transporter ATP-binding protein [Planctomycetota bacterium]